METILRGFVVYVFLMIVFRVAGKRTLSEATTFDLVLLLIISETTQNAMVDNDHSLTGGALLILTLVGTDIAFSLLKLWVPPLETVMDGSALILVENGLVHQGRMRRERVDESDILEAARMQQGLENLTDIKYAVLERGGKITIVPQTG
jgi:uncharacterized membrane protein YcaP (DUF421 family)